MNYYLPKIINSKTIKDRRGFLQEIVKDKSKKFKFSLLVKSKKNVFRGMHFQEKKQQEKILVVAKGKIIDFFLNLRKKSSSFGKIFKFKLKQNTILFIPKGFAHGYKTIEDDTLLIYFLSEYRFKKYERTIDPFEKILKLNLNKKLIFSKKDQKGMSFNQFKNKIKSL